MGKTEKKRKDRVDTEQKGRKRKDRNRLEVGRKEKDEMGKTDKKEDECLLGSTHPSQVGQKCYGIIFPKKDSPGGQSIQLGKSAFL